MPNNAFTFDYKKLFDQAKANQGKTNQQQPASAKPTNGTAKQNGTPSVSSSMVGGALVGGYSLPGATKKKSGSYSYTVNAGNQAYVDQLNSLYEQIMGRGQFQYDLNGDLLYRQMADRYTQLGQQAMMDTMGQAAALTGGYGNSYAQSVGNQANQQYLTALNDQVPNLYQQAYNVWQGEGDRLLQMYDLAAQHPGIIEALKPRTYTYTPKDEQNESKISQLASLLTSAQKNQTGSTNALAEWYYKLLNSK